MRFPMSSKIKVHRTQPGTDFGHLKCGQKYQVVESFTDYDGVLHPIDEVWQFNGSYFLPYDNGLTLLVTIDRSKTTVRLQWRDNEQAKLIESLEKYLKPCQ